MSIYRGLYAEMNDERIIAEQVAAMEVAEACNEFVRQAQAYLVEPKGLRQSSVERAKLRRGWLTRVELLAKAHCSWVDADSRNAMGYHAVCVRRAQAAYALLIFALGTWTVPANINVPRAAMA
jgi:hypothetical protein